MVEQRVERPTTGQQHDIALRVHDLKVYFYTRQGVGKAVDGASFEFKRGQTLGLVGESGCGKSVTGLTIMGLNPKPASRVVGGEIWFNGVNLLELPEHERRAYRGKRLTMVLQDPMTALNPVYNIANQLTEPLRIHEKLHGKRLTSRAISLLRLLRIPTPERRIRNYPHQFSGGMRQRVVGAIALSCNPQVFIADEPTTSLDVTVQAAYLSLLKDIQQQTGLSILFITHDFGVVGKMCDQVAVMYAGKVVETAPTWELFEHPYHPYSEALINSVPNVLKGTKRLTSIEGNPPSIYNKPQGCPFAVRCQYAMDRCYQEYPPEVQVAPGHTTSCWRYV